MRFSIKDGGYEYYLEKDGAMRTGWSMLKEAGYEYYASDNSCQPVGSRMYNHWVDGKKYYIKDDGLMARDELL